MQFPASLSAKTARQAEELRQLDRRGLKDLFRTLPAPSLLEMHGEYDAELLDQGGRLPELIIRALFNRDGRWKGKAFAPTTDQVGKGYNTFQRQDCVIQRFPMRTYLALGHCGCRLSLHLDYRSLNNGFVRSMVDEVRKVTTGVYLGFGVVGPEILLRRKIPFLLTGPVRCFSPVPAIAAQFRTVRTQPKFLYPSPV